MEGRTRSWGGVRAVRGTRQKEVWGNRRCQTREHGGGGVRSVRQGTGECEQRTWHSWVSWLWAAELVGREGNRPKKNRTLSIYSIYVQKDMI
jgi:hypothetical protein